MPQNFLIYLNRICNEILKWWREERLVYGNFCLVGGTFFYPELFCLSGGFDNLASSLLCRPFTFGEWCDCLPQPLTILRPSSPLFHRFVFSRPWSSAADLINFSNNLGCWNCELSVQRWRRRSRTLVPSTGGKENQKLQTLWSSVRLVVVGMWEFFHLCVTSPWILVDSIPCAYFYFVSCFITLMVYTRGVFDGQLVADSLHSIILGNYLLINQYLDVHFDKCRIKCQHLSW
jgi:hypothetical protein